MSTKDSVIQLIERFLESENVAQLAMDYLDLKQKKAPSEELSALSRYINSFVQDARWNIPKLKVDLARYLKSIKPLEFRNSIDIVIDRRKSM